MNTDIKKKPADKNLNFDSCSHSHKNPVVSNLELGDKQIDS